MLTTATSLLQVILEEQLWEMLHSGHMRLCIKTTPYHPQTDGLVEQFNSTLKSVPRTAADGEEKDWDRLSPYFIFAYLEVPQASTGFSLVKLLYGSPVCGLLDILKESSEAQAKGRESVVSYVLTVQRDSGGI